MDPRRRSLLWALVVAAALGFACGWYTRLFTRPTPESRAHDVFDEMRKRVRELTR